MFLVDLGLIQVGDDPGAVLVAIVPDPGAAQVLATLLDGVGAAEVGLGHAAEGTPACVYETHWSAIADQNREGRA